jgi:predicted dehydrogenase
LCVWIRGTYKLIKGPDWSTQPAVQAASSLTLKAIYSRSLKSAKSLAETVSNVDLYSDDSGSGKSLDDLLARPDIQAVTIALPILNQPVYVRKALLAGKHVLSEKPIAENMKDAIELLLWYRKEVDSKTVFWSVAENYRFLNNFNQAAEERKKMGRLLGFKVEYYSMLEGGKYFETE